MANTKRRTNVSLDTKLFKRATEYGREHGRSLSSLIEQGLRGILDGAPVLAEHTNLATPPPDRDMLRELVRETFLEFLNSRKPR